MSKELTRAWKAGKLKNGWYFCKLKNGLIHHFEFNDKDFTDLTCHIVPVAEVLTACNYDHFVDLTEKVKELKRDIKVLTNNYKLLEKQQAENLANGQALVDEFGDFETLYEELQNLRSILKECKNIVAHDCWQEAQFPDGQIARRKDILKRLEKALNEFN